MANIGQHYISVDDLVFDIQDVIRAREKQFCETKDHMLLDQINDLRNELALIEQVI